MPKVSESFDASAYAPVADRITLFYKTHPTGRIITSLVSREGGEVLFLAKVYRFADERRPAATGWASERVNDGEINAVACVENTETSAIGRALANLGLTANARRPSREEMEKAARARRPFRAPSADSDALQKRADAHMNFLAVINAAEAAGLRAERAERWRLIIREGIDAALLVRVDRRLRAWILRQDPDVVRLRRL